MRVYVDTNVFIDYLAKRKDKFRDLGLIAFEFFRRTIEEGHEIIISDLLLKELGRIVDDMDIVEILDWLNTYNKTIKVETLKEDKILANKISKECKLPYSDCLHSVLAKKMNVDYLITRNIKDFPDLVKVTLPESL